MTPGWVATAAVWLLWIALLEPPLPRWLVRVAGPVIAGITNAIDATWSWLRDLSQFVLDRSRP